MAVNQDSALIRRMAKLLKRLHVGEGDILALKHRSPIANKEAIDVLVEALEKMNLDVLVIVVDSFDDLSVLNELEMNKRGWFRISKMKKIVLKAPETND